MHVFVVFLMRLCLFFLVHLLFVSLHLGYQIRFWVLDFVGLVGKKKLSLSTAVILTGESFLQISLLGRFFVFVF